MSYLNPTLILMADLLRDGGSYFLMYQADDQQRYSLRTQVRLDSGMKRLGYERPKVFCEATNFSRELTWAETQELGESLRSLNQAVVSEGGVKRLLECLEVFSKSGQLEHVV